MIQVLMFDLGMTLVDQNRQPFPHVTAALTAISNFQTAAGKPLASCLVSDFDLAEPPVTAAKVNAIFERYLQILDGTSLRPFFEPVKKRVTLSTNAGVRKPDAKIFQTALHRLGSKAKLEDCMLITEDAPHIEAARTTLHMQALQFGKDFDDWSQAPALIAHLVAPAQFANTEAALKSHLSAKGIELLKAEPGESEGKIHVHGQVWHSVPMPDHPDLDNIQIAVPVEGQVARGKKGEFKSSSSIKPSAGNIAEASHYVRTLAAQGQISGRPGAFRATHDIETDSEGRRKLVRKRFSAI
jgi:hypothetical protein